MHQTIIPDFTFNLARDHKKEAPPFEIIDGVFKKSDARATISIQNMAHITEHAFDLNGKLAFVVGSPILKDCVNRRDVAEMVLKSNDLITDISNINGEFFVIVWDEKMQTLHIATDRFSSYPVYWAKNDTEFCVSYNYMSLVQHCADWDGFNLRPEKAYEFFVLQRLMGRDTHDTITRQIAPATLLSYQIGNDVCSERYWNPNYKKNASSSKKELIKEFVRLFEKSVRIRSQCPKDKGNPGIFLSGGHDSRLVSAYTGTKSNCYTLSFQDNLEVECARRIARASGHEHIFCQLNQKFFEKALDASTSLSGALYATDHALFLAEGMTPTPNGNDVYLHGHGLDFMYQGMYLHARALKLFGRDTFIKRFVNLPPNLTEHFIRYIPFRSRYDLSKVFLQKRSEMYQSALKKQVSDIEREAKTLSDNPMDQWEYMVFHHPSRHYTFSNVLSQRSFGELRTPSFDNDLYDFYLRLPFKYRLHGDILRGALYKKSMKVAHIPTANHGLPAAWGPYQKTFATIARKVLKHLTFGTLFHPPQSKDRTWPDRDDYFRDHPDYYKRALSALDDQNFKTFLDFVDWKKLEDNKENLLKERFGGVFLVTLMSYYEFYNAVMANQKTKE